MLRLKSKIKELKARIIKYLNKVPVEIHEKALNKILTMEETIKQLTKKNILLERQVAALEKDIDYRKEERRIDHNLIVDLMVKILKYTDVPEREVKTLEEEVNQAKAEARRNYGR